MSKPPRGISAIVSAVLLIAIVILAAAGLYFWLGGLATKQSTTEKAVVITATVLNGNGTLAIVVLDGTFTGQYLNTTDGTLCDFGESVTLTQGQQDTCTVPPKEGTTILYGPDVGQTSVQMSPSEVPDIVMQGAGAGSSSWSQSSNADFNEGSFSGTSLGSITISPTSSNEFEVDVTKQSFSVTPSTTPSVETVSNGNFVLTWNSFSDTYDVYASVLWPNGSRKIAEFVANSDTSGSQRFSAVGVDNNTGDFVIAWEQNPNTGAGDVEARRFWANGTAKVSDFTVNTNTTNEQAEPSVAVDPSGNFVIAWSDSREGSSDYDVYAKAYWANGSVRTSEFRVNANTTNNQQFGNTGSSTHYPVRNVAMDAAGNYVIVWEDYRDDASNADAYYKIFSSNDQNTTGDVRVNRVTTNSQDTPAVAVTPSGSFVVSWTDSRSGSTDVYVKGFYANGTNRTDDTQVNTPSSGSQYNSVVAIDPAGNYVVSWTDERTGTRVRAFAYWANDTTRKSDFQVNVDTTSVKNHPAAAFAPSGDYIIAWEDHRYIDCCAAVLGSIIFASVFFANDTVRAASNYSTAASGSTYLSAIRDTGFSPAQFNGTFTVTEIKPSSTSISYTLFFSNQSNFSVNTSESVSNPDSSIATTARYVRYRANLTTTDMLVTPAVTAVSLSYKPLTFSLTYTVNFASGIGWVYLNQTCVPANTSFVDGPTNLGGAAFFTKTLSNLATRCNYTSFANTTTGGVIGVQTFNP